MRPSCSLRSVRVTAALLVLVGACAHDRTLPSQHDLLATEEVRLVTGMRLPLVRARLCGQGPYWFGLDTGTSMSILSPAVARSLGLPALSAEDSGALAGAGASMVEVPSLELGRARFLRFAAVVHELDGPKQILGVPFGGVLSMNVFAGVLATLDMPRRRLLLTPGRLPEADGNTLLELSDLQGVPTVDVRIGERTMALLLDSGADGFLILPGGMRAGQTASVGGHFIPARSIREGRGHARLGSDFFERFVATFDQSHRTIRLLRRG